MQKLTQEQAIVIMGYTGITTVSFPLYHKDVEERYGMPIWTHQFAEEAFALKLKELYREDFIALCPFQE